MPEQEQEQEQPEEREPETFEEEKEKEEEEVKEEEAPAPSPPEPKFLGTIHVKVFDNTKPEIIVRGNFNTRILRAILRGIEMQNRRTRRENAETFEQET